MPIPPNRCWAIGSIVLLLLALSILADATEPTLARVWCCESSDNMDSEENVRFWIKEKPL